MKHTTLLILVVSLMLIPMSVLAGEIPVAIFSSDSTTMTFTIADESTVDNKAIYRLNNKSVDPGWIINFDKPVYGKVSKVIFDEAFASARPTSTAKWFYGYAHLQVIEGIENLNTSEVTNMSYMFLGCSSLTSLDVSKFDTRNVTDMWCMFYGCSSLMSLDVSKFDTRNVTDMGCMFYGCSSLMSLDVSKFDTKNMTDMMSMFLACYSLSSLDVSKFDTRNVTNMRSMFSGCFSLTSLDVSKFDTKNVTDMGWMFSDCFSLTSLDVSKFDTKNVTDMGCMFFGCFSLTGLDVSKFGTKNVTDMRAMFSDCSSLTSLDVSKFDTKNVTDMMSMFRNCSSLTSLDVSKFDTRNVTHMEIMFSGCSGLRVLNVGGNDFSSVINYSDDDFRGAGSSTWPCYLITNSSFQKSVLGDKTYSDTYKWHGGYFALTPNVDVYCAKLSTNADGSTRTLTFTKTNVNLSNTSVKQEESKGIYALVRTGWGENNIRGTITKVVFAKSFDDARPETTAYWFSDLSKLVSVDDIKYLHTDSVTDMRGMFSVCSSLTSLDVSKFDTRNVTDMECMFFGCFSLTSLDVSGFDTKNVRWMHDMFSGCSGLKYLNLGDNDFKNAENKGGAFYNVGTTANPCHLSVGVNFDKSVLGDVQGEAPGYYSWLGGCFSANLGADVSTLDNVVYLDDTEARRGSTVTLSFRLKNADPIQALQFDLHLPDGITVATDASGDALIAMSTARNVNKYINALNSRLVSEGLFRVVAYSSQGKSVAAGDDDIITLTLNIADGLAAGDYTLSIDNIQMTDNVLTDIRLKGVAVNATLTVRSYSPGDVNDDGNVNVTDLAYTVQYILGNNPTGFVIGAADMTGDGNINVTDLASVVALILGNGSGAKPHRQAPPTTRASYSDASALENVVYLNDTTATAGGKLNLSFRLKNASKIQAVQFDLHLPAGFTIATDEYGETEIAMSSARNTSRTIDVLNSRLVSDSLFRVVAYSSRGRAVASGDDELLTLTLNVDESLAGNYMLSIDNIQMTDDILTDIRLKDVTMQSTIRVNKSTGIRNVSIEPASGNVYSLEGKLVSRNGTRGLAKGVYVVNGRKVVVR